MAQLIKSINGSLFDNISGEVKGIKTVSGEFQDEDYIQMNGLIAFLLDFSRIEKTVLLNKPLNFGLRNKNLIKTVNLNINY